MRRVILAAVLAVIVLLILVFGAPRDHVRSDVRGVHPLYQALAPEPRHFDPEQSAALFVGVRKFGDETGTVDVEFAADDAVDLAHAFAIDPQSRLVSPSRVVIALSGRPQKKESKARLEELLRAGAREVPARHADILLALQKQAAAASSDGVLIVSIASHGFVHDGIPYILGADSPPQFPDTALPAPRLFDLAAMSEARRSLFFIDACRERITGGARGGPSAATAAPILSRMGHIDGQVVFYAAAAGGYAYDGDGNGVFTSKVLEGLRCNAAVVRGVVTAETLRGYVERNVRRWIRQHRDPSVAAATQFSMEGDAKNMPLATCGGPLPPPPPGDVARATTDGSHISAFDEKGAPLWTRDLRAPVVQVKVEDLDNDNRREVIAGSSKSITVFDGRGNVAWTAAESLPLREFVVDHLLRRDPTLQIAALWSGDKESQSTVTTYAANGQKLATYSQNDRLQHILIDRPTTRHNRRIIASGVDEKRLTTLLLLDSSAKLLWQGVLLRPMERLAHFVVGDRDKYSRDIKLTTASGDELHLDFDGKVLERSSPSLIWRLTAGKKRRSP